MEKTLYFFVAVLFLFLAATQLLNYSDYLYDQLYEGKCQVIIEMQDEQSNQDFVEEITKTAKENDTNLMYIKVENASGLKPTIHLYTTSLQPKFLNFPHNCPNEMLSPGESISTKSDDSLATYQLFVNNIDYDYEIHDISEITDFQLFHSAFYTDDNVSLLSALNQIGYTTSVPEKGETYSQIDMERLGFLILLIFLFLSALFYAYLFNQEIAVKKMNGFSIFSILQTTFFKQLLVILSIAIAISLGLFMIDSLLFGINNAFHFVNYCILKIVFFICITVLLYLIACLFTTITVKTSALRGNRSHVFLQIFSYVARILASIVLILQLSSTYDVMLYNQSLKITYNTLNKEIKEYTTVTLNAKSASMDDEEYYSLAEQFIFDVFQEYNAMVIDASEINYNILYVSKSYLDFNPVYRSDGTRILPEDIVLPEKEGNTVLLPENYEYHPEEDSHEHEYEEIAPYVDENTNVIYYQPQQNFLTVTPLYAEYNGYLTDPEIIFLDNETLYWESLQILGEQYLYIDCQTSNPLEELMPIIEKNKLSNIIVETQSVEEEFHVYFYNIQIVLVRYIIIGVIYLILLVLITLFENIIYYENHKRRLSILRLHGYGFRAYLPMIILKLLTDLLLAIISVIFGIHICFLLFACIADGLTFLICIKKLSFHNTPLYLKGNI